MVTRQKYWMICFLLLLLMTGSHDAWSDETPRRLIFLGDSLTAGYTLDVDQAFPAVIQRYIREEGWPIVVVNSGISGDTSAGGLRRLDWLMRQPIHVLVVALGANDGLRGFAPSTLQQNLTAIILKVRETQPHALILLVGMRFPSNLGTEYVKQLEAVYAQVAREQNVPLLPFLLEGVAADPSLNLPDGIHPNAEGQRRVATHVWNFLRPHLESLLQSTSL